MTADQMVSVTIDGQPTSCPAGCTVYEAATEAGIHIPTFCQHEKLVPVGACRMCLVEIEGTRGLQTSCTTPVREGMIVRVHTSPAAVKARRANIEFLLTNHPLDCPVCDKGGECPLQNQALLDGPGESRYIEEKRHKNKRYALGELIVLDQERCVLCWRCVRFLDEWADDHQLDLFGRGANTRIDTYPGRPLSSKWQGNTIDICPVGALTSRIFRFEARVWELTSTPSICPMCSVGCNIALGVKNNKLRRITPRENMEVNDTWLCDKGRFTHGYVDHPDRLETPLIRRSGELTPTTWDEAFDLIARRFREIAQEHGPQAFAGLGSTRVSNEANYLFQRFMRSVLGTNSVDHLGRIPPGVAPLSSLADLERRDVILLLDCDPSTQTPLVELWIKKAVLRHGAKVLIASPRRSELGRYGGPWLGYRPGSEVPLLNGLARTILDAGLESETTRVPNMDDFSTWLGAHSLPQVERITGVQAETMQQAAQMLARAESPIILYGPSWVQGPHGQARLKALANLTLLLGDIEAGFVAEDNNALGALEMGVVPDLYPGRQPFDNTKVRNRLSGLWRSKLSPVEGLDYRSMMTAVQEGNLQAIWIMGADPANECRVAKDALSRIPFLVVQDLFATETASLAEVVLPVASFAETDGSFINLTGRLQVVRAAIRPPGHARSDWWIVVELARRMVGGSLQRSWDFARPADVLSEISRLLPAYRGLDYAKIGDEGCQVPVEQPALRRTFSLAESDLPPHDPEYPLTLVTGRLLYDRGTLLSHAEQIQDLLPRASVVLHPFEAAKLDLVDGDRVLVISAEGQLGFTVKVSDEIVPGAAFVPLNLGDAPLSVLFADRWTPPQVRIVK